MPTSIPYTSAIVFLLLEKKKGHHSKLSRKYLGFCVWEHWRFQFENKEVDSNVLCWMAGRLTGEGEHWGEDDVDSSTVDVKHDAKVDGYAAQNCKTVDEGPVRCIQRDLTNGGGEWQKVSSLFT